MKILKKILRKIANDEEGFLRNYVSQKLPYYFYKRNLKKTIGNNKCKLPLDYRRKIKKFWKEKLNISVSTKGFEYFYISGIKDCESYIPEDIFFKYFIRKLNKFSLAYAYADKNVYSKLFPNTNMPKSVIRNINGRFFNENYEFLTQNDALNIFHDEIRNNNLIIKPSIDSGSGKNVCLIRYSDFPNNLSINDYIISILNKYKKDFIVQRFLKQSDLLNLIYPHSLNTIRIISFETDGKIEILASILKMGNNSNYLDKVSMGGLSCGINFEGKLNDFAYSSDNSNPHYTHPQTNFVFKNTVIPNFQEALDLVKKLHINLSPNFRFVSWDIAFDSTNSPVLIEVNLKKQGVMLPQLNCGPLFGDGLSHVIDYIKK